MRTNAVVATANEGKWRRSASEAEGKTREVLREKKKSQRQLARYYIDRGVNELEHGDKFWDSRFSARHIAQRVTPRIFASAFAPFSAPGTAPCRARSSIGDKVQDVAFSPDGTKIATSSYLVSMETGNCKATAVGRGHGQAAGRAAQTWR